MITEAICLWRIHCAEKLKKELLNNSLFDELLQVGPHPAQLAEVFHGVLTVSL